MKVCSYSEARQKLAELLDEAQNEEVLIKRKDGTVFSLKSKREKNHLLMLKESRVTYQRKVC